MEHRIENLDEHTWLIEEYNETASVYMYLLEGSKRALLIDSGFGVINLREICESLTTRPITVALTHGHVDHIGGTGAFEEVWISFRDEVLYRLHSEEETRRIFTDEPLHPVQTSLHFYKENMAFDLGGRMIRVIETPGHSVGSVSLLDEQRRWLYTGDTCCKAHVLLQMDYAASLETYKESLEELLAMEDCYDITWPGHHTKPVEKSVIRDFLTAVDGILDGSMQGEPARLPMGEARLLEYKEIGIEY